MASRSVEDSDTDDSSNSSNDSDSSDSSSNSSSDDESSSNESTENNEDESSDSLEKDNETTESGDGESSNEQEEAENEEMIESDDGREEKSLNDQSSHSSPTLKQKSRRKKLSSKKATKAITNLTHKFSSATPVSSAMKKALSFSKKKLKKKDQKENVDSEEESSEEDDDDDDDDNYDEMDDENPTSWKHAALVEDQLQLEISLKSMHNNNQGGVNIRKKLLTVIDPLGLHNDITRFVSDSSLGINPNSEGFVSSRYLAIVHKNSDEKQFITGKNRVNGCIDNISDDMKQLVKNHLGRFIYCKDNLEEIFQQNQLNTTSTKKNRGTSIPSEQFQITWLNNMNLLVKNLQNQTTELFEPMIQVRGREENIKKMLTIIERLSFALNLPSLIEQCLSQGDFEKMVTYYKKAKYLMHDSQSPIFQKMYLDIITKQVVETRDKLLSILDLHPDISNTSVAQLEEVTEEKISIIDYLYDLDCETDPSWYHTNSYQDFIIEQLHSWNNHRLTNDNSIYESTVKDTSVKIEGNSSNESSEENDHSDVSPVKLYPNTECELRDKEQEICHVCEGMCDTLEYHIPNLAIYCFESSKRIDRRMKQDALKFRNLYRGSIGMQKNQMLEFRKQMIESERMYIDELFTFIFMVFCNFANNLISEVDSKTVDQPMLMKCVYRIAQCTETLISNASTTEKVGCKVFSYLIDNSIAMLNSTIEKLFQYAIQQVKCLHSYHYGPSSDWRVFKTSKKEAHCTKVQTLFANHFDNVLTHLRRLVPMTINLNHYCEDKMRWSALTTKWQVYVSELTLCYSDVLHHSMMQVISIANRLAIKNRTRKIIRPQHYSTVYSFTIVDDHFSSIDDAAVKLPGHEQRHMDPETKMILLLGNCLNCLNEDGLLKTMIHKYVTLISTTLSTLQHSTEIKHQNGIDGLYDSDAHPLKQSIYMDESSHSNTDYSSDTSSRSSESSDSDDEYDKEGLPSVQSRTKEHLVNLSIEDLEKEIWDNTKPTYELLETMMIDSYVQCKIRHLNLHIVHCPSMLDVPISTPKNGSMDSKSTCLSVRPYIIELLNHLVRVHYKFDQFGIGDRIRRTVLSKLLERITELLLDQVRTGVAGPATHNHPQFTNILQLEVDYLADCFQHYLTNHSLQVIQRLNQWIVMHSNHSPNDDQTSDSINQSMDASKRRIHGRRRINRPRDNNNRPINHALSLQQVIRKTQLHYNLFHPPNRRIEP